MSLLFMAGCALPSASGDDADPRNALMSFLDAWSARDAPAMVERLCEADRRLLRKADEEARAIAPMDETGQIRSLLPGLGAREMLSALLGPPPTESTLGLRTRVAVARAELPAPLTDRLELAGWVLSREGGSYRVCLPKRARSDLDALARKLRAIRIRLQGVERGGVLEILPR